VRYAFYPGCALESSAREYKKSTVAVARSLGIDLQEIPDWICCGSSPAHMADDLLAIALPSQVLLAASRMDTEGVLVSCASCYNRLKAANHAARSDPLLRDTVAEVLGEPYDGGVRVRHMVEAVLDAVQQPGFAAKVSQRLGGLRVASYYGCLLVRPPEVTGFDDPEDPQSLDRIAAAIGAEPVEWNYKVECCGASLAFGQTDIVRKLSGDVLDDALRSGADLMVVACPLCHSNLDLRQPEIVKHTGLEVKLPVLYFTQLIGLALGHSGRAMGLGKHVIDPSAALVERGIKL
jgi:heterodisulfide reductase subunit B